MIPLKILLQIPTPTPFAYGTIDHGITINSSDYRIWSFADDAINVWNYNPAVGQVIQTAIIIILVIAFVSVIRSNLQMLQDDSG